jgi:hypothetical protein
VAALVCDPRQGAATAANVRAAAADLCAAELRPVLPEVCLQPSAEDYDCAGGSGNGPLYVEGPISVRPPDPFGLDADGDGVGCERD